MKYRHKIIIVISSVLFVVAMGVVTVVTLRVVVPHENKDTQSVHVDSNLQARIDGGVQFHCIWSSYTDKERAETLDKIAAANFDRVRIDMAWSGLEDKKDYHGKWYVDLADKCVDMARKRGLKVLVTMHMTPDWANGGKGKAAPPTHPADFGRFMTWAAEHFKNRVSAYEIWNEPDPDQEFFTGTTAQYVSLLKAGFNGVKKSDPSAKVVLGAPSTNNDQWINEVYTLGGKNYFDIMATHPYQAISDKPPEFPDDGHKWWLSHFPAVLEVMKKYGDEKKEVWFTEFGYSTHANGPNEANYQRGVTEQQQADYLVRAFEYVQKNYPTVTAMYIYNARDRVDSDEHLNSYGILSDSLQPKPAYYALQRYLRNK